MAAGVAAVLVLGGFAMVAIVPVTLTPITALRSSRARPLRWWAVALGGLYTAGLITWALRSDPAPSLTKDLHPVLAGLIVAAALTVVVRHLLLVRADR